MISAKTSSNFIFAPCSAVRLSPLKKKRRFRMVVLQRSHISSSCGPWRTRDGCGRHDPRLQGFVGGLREVRHSELVVVGCRKDTSHLYIRVLITSAVRTRTLRLSQELARSCMPGPSCFLHVVMSRTCCCLLHVVMSRTCCLISTMRSTSSLITPPRYRD